MGDQLSYIYRRLLLLGATPDEVDRFAAVWDDLDDDWTEQTRTRFSALPDHELRNRIIEYRTDLALELAAAAEHKVQV